MIRKPEESRISSAMEAVCYPVQYIIYASRRTLAKYDEDMANQSTLVSQAADAVFDFDCLTETPESSMAIANMSAASKASFLKSAKCASQALHSLRRCDTFHRSLHELLEDQDGKYKMAPGTAEQVTRHLAQFRDGMRIGWWDNECRLTEAKKRSKNPADSEGGEEL